MNTVYITKQGYEKLKKDLEKLTKQKQELSTEIGEAASQGDLRENAAYTYAKEKQAETLRRIDELKTKLRNVKITDNLEVDKSCIRIGATVTFKETGTANETVYTLAGTEEADPSSGTISVDTPLAQAMLGKKAGDSFCLSLPSGDKTFKVSRLEYK